MALPPPNLPAVSRLVLKYSIPSTAVTAASVIHVLSSGLAPLEVFNRVTTAWDAGQMAHAPIGLRLGEIDVTPLDNSTATQTFTTVGIKWDGTSTGDFIPQACVLVKYTTGFRGLASVGHTYAPYVTEEAQANGSLTGPLHTTISAAWVAFVNTLTTQTIPLQVVSYGREATATLPAAPATNHTVTAVAVDVHIATQRRRQDRIRG